MATARARKPRRDRERELVIATRMLFDERGHQEAPIEEIARTVGIARGLVYRHFSSKEELYVLTVTDYLRELTGVLIDGAGGASDPPGRLRLGIRAYAEFCLRYPAFLDSIRSIAQRPAVDLREVISESVWLRLGQGIARCVDLLIGVLRDGVQEGVFTHVEDPEYVANVLWTQTLGIMDLARIGVGVRQLGPGVPGMFPVEPERVVDTCVEHALRAVGAPDA